MCGGVDAVRMRVRWRATLPEPPNIRMTGMVVERSEPEIGLVVLGKGCKATFEADVFTRRWRELDYRFGRQPVALFVAG